MRRDLLRVLLSLLLLASALEGSARAGEPRTLREIVRPGRVEAIQLSVQGTEAISQGSPAEGVALLEKALRFDPYLAPAWTNLSAGYITLCRPEGALVAAMVGRIFDPRSRVAADNLRIAMELSCEDPPAETFVSSEELAALRAQTDPALFESAASSRRARGDHLLAVFYEEWALRLGADEAAVTARIAGDFASAGLLRAAHAALAQHGGEREPERLAGLSSSIAAIAERARPLSERIAEEGRMATEQERDAILRYCEVLLARGLGEESVLGRMRELLGIGAPSTLREEWGSIRVGADWALLGTDVSSAGYASEAPLATLRRFPGDTQITLHPWTGAFEKEKASTRLLRLLAGRSALIVEPWEPCEADAAKGHCTKTLVEVDTGLHGGARIEARLYGAQEGKPTLAALTLVGDEGCGAPCAARSREACDEALSTLVPAEAAADASSGAWKLPIPAAWRAPRVYYEDADPWRTHPLGPQLLIDLPPGVVVGRVSGPFADDSCARETALWLRGGFSDIDGIEVRIGDETWSGWVDHFPGEAARLDEHRATLGERAPRTDPAAKLVRSASLDEALAKARRPVRGHVALYDSGAMPGRWFVYHLAIGSDLVVVALPVIEGARSLSLHWIALTLRAESGDRLPPPVDLSETLDIDFQRFEGRDARRDPRAGLLRAAELQVAVPRGYRVSLSASSSDGFPVTFRSDDGGKIVIERLPPARGADLAARTMQTEALLGPPLEPGWSREGLGRRAELASAGFAPEEEGDGERRVFVVVPLEGEVPAFRIAMTRAEGADDELWAFEREIVEDSLRLRRSRGRK